MERGNARKSGKLSRIKPLFVRQFHPNPILAFGSIVQCPKKVTFKILLEPPCNRQITSSQHLSLSTGRACLWKLPFLVVSF